MTDHEFLRWVASLYGGWNDKDADGIADRIFAIADRLEKLEAFKAMYDEDLKMLRGSVTEKLLYGKIVPGVGFAGISDEV